MAFSDVLLEISFMCNNALRELTWRAPDNMNPRNILDVLRNDMGFSGTAIKKLRHPDMLYVDGKPVRVIDKISAGSTLITIISDSESLGLLPEEIPLCIVYEDDSMIAVDISDRKAIHPSSIYPNGTLANGIAWHMKKTGCTGKVRPVTRLDRNTSGIALFAKTAHIQYNLSLQSKSNEFVKEYLGICQGELIPNKGTLSLSIRRNPSSIIEREVHPDGDACVTHYQTKKTLLIENKVCSLVHFILETGRTHQIRVHCSSIGNPLLGDTLYGGSSDQHLSGQALHCDKIIFIHPITRERIVIQSNRSSSMFELLHE